MSTENPPESSTDNQNEQTSNEVKPVFLVPYPKIVFLYPSVIVAFIVAIWMTFTHGLDPAKPIPEGSIPISILLSQIFMGVFLLNIVVISFDFPRTTSLTLFFIVASAVLGCFVLFSNKPEWLPVFGKILGMFKPVANAQFYWSYVVIMGLMFLAVKVAVQFDYWEVRPNELLHHHGVLSDMKRYSAPRMRVEKEIGDLFEYALLGAGRLVLQPSGESRAIVLDNIFSVNKKEEELIHLLGALKVKIREVE